MELSRYIQDRLCWFSFQVPLFQMPLTWDSAQVLLEFYHPSFLPAVEENKALTPEVQVKQ